MSTVAAVINAFEGAPLPDALRRAAVSFLVEGARRGLQGSAAEIDADPLPIRLRNAAARLLQPYL